MRSHARLMMIVFATGFAAACADRPASAPSEPADLGIGAPVAALTVGQCAFNTARQLAGRYFTSPQTATTARGIIGDMRQAGAYTEAARNLGFDLFVLIGANVSVNPDVQMGSDLVNEVLNCMYSDPALLPLTFPEDFTVALDWTKNGAFAVRGGSTDDTDPVSARLNSYSAVASPAGWGAALAGSPLNTFSPLRILVYGKPGVLSPTQHYDWRTVPRLAKFNPPAVVGLCIDADANVNEVVRKSSQTTGIGFLPFVDTDFTDPASGCGGSSIAAAPGRSLNRFASDLFRKGLEVLGPRPLAATTVLSPGGLGGSTGGIGTEYGPTVVDTVRLTFSVQPHDSQLCTLAPCVGAQDLGPVTVLATHRDALTGQFVPVGGVSVDLVPVDNNGQNVLLLGTHPVTTGEDGLARFTSLGITKTGGYRLLTVAEVVVNRSAQIVIPSATSDRFNIRP